MAGSRAASACEPGQIREEAALSDTARAPRISLAGADDRRARPRTSHEDGCTVRFFLMSEEKNLEVARRAMERWNAGDLEGVLDMYSDDAVMHPAAEWPEQASWRGREGVRENMEQWRSVWDSSEMVVDSLEGYGDDRVVASGAWLTRGRVSGLDGRWAFNIVLTIRDGKIATHEWFTEREPALAAARDS